MTAPLPSGHVYGQEAFVRQLRHSPACMHALAYASKSRHEEDCLLVLWHLSYWQAATYG